MNLSSQHGGRYWALPIAIAGASPTLGKRGRDVVLHPGQGFLIPGGETHSATAGDEGCELLECYAPPRVPTAATALSTRLRTARLMWSGSTSHSGMSSACRVFNASP